MMVMVANVSGHWTGVLSQRYPGGIGNLFSPKAHRGPHEDMPYALDNGAYPLAQKNLDWKEEPWLKLLDWCATKAQRPLWAVVPDVVYMREPTIERWHKYAPIVRERGIRPAFAVQDDMTFDDVPDSDCMLFLGGSTGWKHAAIGPWCRRFPGRVHVARVNESERLMKSYAAGAVSVDGTGWHHTKSTSRDGVSQRQELLQFLEMQKHERKAA